MSCTALPTPASASTSDSVLLKDLASRYGFPSASQTAKQTSWKSQYSSLTFHLDSRRLVFNSRVFWLNGPVIKKRGGPAISHIDAETVIRPLLQSNQILAGQGYSMVVLDAGHGGSDAGAIGPGNVLEKTLVLDVTQRIRRKLNASNVAVRMTRTNDRTLRLPQRPRLASKWGADLFVSIHANKAANRRAQGVETFVLPAPGFPSTSSRKPDQKAYTGNRHDAANTLLGGLIQQGLLAQTKTTDRGVKRARFTVLRDAPCPAALVEIGFLSNPAEARKLNDPAYRAAIAEGIAQGILTYLVKAEASR